MSERFKRRHINIQMILRVMGWLLMIEAAFMLVPLVTGVIYDEMKDVKNFGLTAVVTAGFGVLLTFGLHPRDTKMGRHEGFLLTTLVWIIFSAFGMIPFMLSDRPVSVTNAFFEAMSGFTTTGCSIFSSIDTYSHSIKMWRGLMNWIGGMGIILFTLAVLPMLNHSGGMQMFNAEVTGITHDKLRPRVSQTAKSLWTIYIALTVILIALLWIGPMDLFDSICYGFSTISTGGFAPHDESVAFFHSDYISVVIMIFMFLGGTSFGLMYKAIHGNWRALWKNDVFRAYIIIILLFLVVFDIYILFSGDYKGLSSITIQPLFHIISTITSTGLGVFDFEEWGAFILSLLFILMFFGSCAGSTSGGAKIDRMLLLIKYTGNELYRCIHPSAVTSVHINGRVMPQSVVAKVIAFLCIYVMLMAFGGILLTAVGLPLVDAFFSSFSCVSNIGFGVGVTGSEGSFELVPDLGKWILSLLMLIGRLELFTVLILFTPEFWRK